MAKMMIMGQTATKAAGALLLGGVTATGTKFAADALGSRLFVQTAAEATSSPRTVDDQKMMQLYRGVITIAVGMLGGKMLWKFSRPLSLGFATGATVSGLDRIATTYDIKRQVKNLFLATADQIPAPATGTVPAYGVMLALPAAQRERSYVGPMLRSTRLNVSQ